MGSIRWQTSGAFVEINDCRARTDKGVTSQEPTAIADCYFDGAPPHDFWKEFEEIPRVKQLSATTWRDSVKLMPSRNQTVRWGLLEGKEDLADLGEIRYDVSRSQIVAAH